jgi:hypothetical protein
MKENNQKGSNIMNTKIYDLKDFSKIRAGGAIKVEIKQADDFKIKVYADDFDYIRVEKLDDTLVLGRKGFDWFFPFHGNPEFYIEIPRLDDLKISGASRGLIKGFKSEKQLFLDISGASHFEAEDIITGSLNLQLSGASHLKAKIQAGTKAELYISGASHLDLKGAAIDMAMEANGASQANLAGFQVQNAHVMLSGASRGTININGKLDTHINGASNLSWSGTAVMGEMEITGASSIQHS